MDCACTVVVFSFLKWVQTTRVEVALFECVSVIDPCNRHVETVVKVVYVMDRTKWKRTIQNYSGDPRRRISVNVVGQCNLLHGGATG